ncbi:MAG: hypothetical protein LBK24_01380 [Puniceicoccales bacterium]|nr:hypothetical protein [Puniceicoccales bacterium]
MAETDEMFASAPTESKGEFVAPLEELFAKLAGPKRYDDYEIEIALLGQYLDQLIKLLGRRPLTQAELERYVLTDDPVYVNSRNGGQKLMISMVSGGNRGKLVQLLAKLVARGHFAAIKKIVLEYKYSGTGHPLWIDLVCEGNFRAEVVNKVPDWLYQRFKNTPTYIIREERTPEEYARLMGEDCFFANPRYIEYRWDLVR